MVRHRGDIRGDWPGGRAGDDSGDTVVVLGGGVGGLTAAQELAERGFRVELHERHDRLGGRSRTIPVPGSGSDGRRNLPGEHGWRLFAGFYRHLPDTMRRIPDPGSADGSVDGNLVPVPGVYYARGGRPDLSIEHPDRITPRSFLRLARATRSTMRQAVGRRELSAFNRRLAVFLTSCDERRTSEWDEVSWWDFLQSDRRSADFGRMMASGQTQHLVAARPRQASARTIGSIGEAYFSVFSGRGHERRVNSVLDGPTSETWFDPWADHLRDLGVRIVCGSTAEALELEDGRIARVRVRDAAGSARSVAADWFVCALPVERARSLWSPAIAAADPGLAAMSELRTEIMSGIQFYLRRTAPIFAGIVHYTEAPWALVSISQAQFWAGRSFPAGYGDGTVRDCLSVNIACWDEPGIVFGKPAVACTPDEIAIEVLAQMRHDLEDGGESVLPDDLGAGWQLDPAVRWPAGEGDPAAPARSDEPVVVNTIGSWRHRPEAATAVPNLFLAADYVRTTTDVASMEAANEAARRGVNALLERRGSSAPRCALFPPRRPAELAWLRAWDAARYRRGKRNLLDR